MAAILGSVLTYGAYLLSHGLPTDPVPIWEARLGEDTVASLSRSGLTAAAFLVGAGAAVIAYRNQRLKEDAHLRDEERRLQDQFVSAAEQIGSDKASTRIAGVYAMAQLAARWIDRNARQQCVDVLCAYLRMPPLSSNIGFPSLARRDTQDEQVRLTIQRVLATYLAKDREDRWQGISLDLRGAELRNFVLNGAVVENFTAANATFVGDCWIQNTDVLGFADLREATFKGKAMLWGSTFAQRARFYGSHFHAEVSFLECKFLDHAWFYDCRFDGTTSFAKTQFGKESGFERGVFTQKAKFTSAIFIGTARFIDTSFGSDCRFAKAEFHSKVDFRRAHFGGRVAFNKASVRTTIDTTGSTHRGSTWAGPYGLALSSQPV